MVNTLPQLAGTSETYDQVFDDMLSMPVVRQGRIVENSIQLEKIKSTVARVITLLNQEDRQNELPHLIISLFQSVSPNQLEYRTIFTPLWEAFIACFQSNDLKKQKALVKGLFTWGEQGISAEFVLNYLHAAIHSVLPYCPVRFS